MSQPEPTSPTPSHRGPIALTTDFGVADGYVGAMKGVILGINPEATVVDVTHAIRPHGIHQGAFVLETVVDAFPPSTVHVVVVDPGVGSARRAIAVATPRGTFVAPDNGVLSWALHVAETDEWSAEVRPRRLPTEARAVVLDRPRFWRPGPGPEGTSTLTPSATFHGRDIFAPVAAHLSRGVPLAELGSPTDELALFPVPRARVVASGRVRGHVIHVDHFGNLITSIAAGPEGAPLRRIARPVVRVGDVVAPLVTHYAAAAPSDIVALVGSSGHLEVSVVNGSAAMTLEIGVGSEVWVVESE